MLVDRFVLVFQAIINAFILILRPNLLLNVYLFVPLTSICTLFEPSLQLALLDKEFCGTRF
jgi:hypothetical protein